MKGSVQFSSVSQSCLTLVTPWNAAPQASLSITNSQSPPKSTSIESVIPSNHLILCHPLLHLPSIFPSIRVFSNESALRIRWPKYWSPIFNISPSNEYPGLLSRVTIKKEIISPLCVCVWHIDIGKDIKVSPFLETSKLFFFFQQGIIW